MAIISRGFRGRGRGDIDPSRIPPGQYPERGFPVLTYGPTPRVETARWSFGLSGLVDPEVSWTWDEFHALPHGDVTVDIHCVTKWSKLDTTLGRGVSRRHAARRASARRPRHVTSSRCDGGYTTNLPLADLTRGKAWIVYTYDGQPLDARARRPGAAARPAPVLLEEREVGARAAVHGRGRARVLGGQRLPRLRRPLARAALPGRLSRRSASRAPRGPRREGLARLPAVAVRPGAELAEVADELAVAGLERAVLADLGEVLRPRRRSRSCPGRRRPGSCRSPGRRRSRSGRGWGR